MTAPFTAVTGPAAPLLLANIDTDVILRIERLATLKPDQMGDYAFEALRFLDDGSDNPHFILNRAPFRGAPILIAGANFGCGSSREAAVWALKGVGLRVIIAESFGDIFAANCFQNGLLPLALPAAQVVLLAAAAAREGAIFTVELMASTIAAPGVGVVTFAVDAQRRAALLEGGDSIDRTIRLDGRIAQWQAGDRDVRPWVWATQARAGTASHDHPTHPVARGAL